MDFLLQSYLFSFDFAENSLSWKHNHGKGMYIVDKFNAKTKFLNFSDFIKRVLYIRTEMVVVNCEKPD